jgi:hypothetical protein
MHGIHLLILGVIATIALIGVFWVESQKRR